MCMCVRTCAREKLAITTLLRVFGARVYACARESVLNRVNGIPYRGLTVGTRDDSEGKSENLRWESRARASSGSHPSLDI